MGAPGGDNREDLIIQASGGGGKNFPTIEAEKSPPKYTLSLRARKKGRKENRRKERKEGVKGEEERESPSPTPLFNDGEEERKKRERRKRGI